MYSIGFEYLLKNRKVTYYILLPAVIAIWGLVIYRLVVRNDSYLMPENSSVIKEKERLFNEHNDYQLTNHKDPFSRNLLKADKIPVEKLEEKDIVKQKKEKKWPVIRLNGYVLNGNKTKCHLTVNGEDKILQANDKVIEDYFISSITPDSIKISTERDYRWFKR